MQFKREHISIYGFIFLENKISFNKSRYSDYVSHLGEYNKIP